jgi:lysophospholipase L1-like esterase
MKERSLFRVGLYWLLMIFFIFLFFRIFDILASSFYSGNTTFRLLPKNQSFQDISSDWNYLIHTNSLGLRGREISEVKRGKRILFLGDSFVFGLGVEEEKTFVHLVGELFTKNGQATEVVNAGIVDYGPENSLWQYRSLKQKFDADVVVLCIYVNDVYDSGDNLFFEKAKNQIRKRVYFDIAFYLFPRTADELFGRYYRNTRSQIETKNSPKIVSELAPDSKSKLEVTKPISMDTKSYTDLLKNYAFSNGITPIEWNDWRNKIGDELFEKAAQGQISFVSVLGGLLISDYYSQCLDLNLVGKPKFLRMINIIRELKDEVQKSNSKFAIVFLPSELQFNSEKQMLNRKFGYLVKEEWLTGSSNLEKELKLFADEESIRILFPTNRFRAFSSQGLVFPHDLHYNESGHKIMADEIFNSIKEL